MDDAAFYFVIAFSVLSLAAGAVFFFGMKQTNDDLLYAQGNIFFPEEENKEKKKSKKNKKKKKAASDTQSVASKAEETEKKESNQSKNKPAPTPKPTPKEQPTAKAEKKSSPQPQQKPKAKPQEKKEAQQPKKPAPVVKKAPVPKVESVEVAREEETVVDIVETKTTEVKASKVENMVIEKVEVAVLEKKEAVPKPVQVTAAAKKSPATKPKKAKKHAAVKPKQTQPVLEGGEVSLDFKETLEVISRGKLAEREILLLGEALIRRGQDAEAEWVSTGRQVKRSSTSSDGNLADSKIGKKILRDVEQQLKIEMQKNEMNEGALKDARATSATLQSELQKVQKNSSDEIARLRYQFKKENELRKESIKQYEAEITKIYLETANEKKEVDMKLKNSEKKGDDKVAELKKSVKEHEAKNADLSQEISDLQSELESAKKSLKDKEAEEAQSADEDDTSEKLVELKTELEKTAKSFAEEQEKSEELQLEKSALKKEIKEKSDKHKYTLELTEKKLLKLEAEVAVNEAKGHDIVRRLSEELKVLRLDLKRSEENVSSLTDQLNSSGESEEKLGAVESDLNATTEELRIMRQERDQLKVENKKQVELLHGYESEASDFNRKMNETKKFETTVEGELNNLSDFKKCLALAFSKIEDFDNAKEAAKVKSEATNGVAEEYLNSDLNSQEGQILK